ncbi:DUF3349 domain-containing protein [Mycobacterium sp.]|uniref:DUF3349 domain-containing protein n=1 Tax=Mycobacterium sp. TaxID=1785 RepID=UPI003F981BB4
MRLTGGLSAIVTFLRAGYPAGTPATGYVPLLALLRRRVTDNEIIAITRKLIARQRRPIDTADIGVEITRVTNEMPSVEDIARVQHRLAAIGRSSDHRGPLREQPPPS